MALLNWILNVTVKTFTDFDSNTLNLNILVQLLYAWAKRKKKGDQPFSSFDFIVNELKMPI